MAVTTTVPAISVVGVHKSFGGQVVLDGVDLHVPEGTVFALLGPNGAGKTTLVNILATLIPADDGRVAVAGHDLREEPDRVRAAIGLTGQFSAVDDVFTARENLQLMADLAHLDRDEGRRCVTDLLERFDLADAADTIVRTYSGGMRRRLDLAMTLIGSPRLIFLDEPTTGLDPRGRRDMWQMVRQLVAEGVTVFLTTQYMEEADQLADRVAVLDHGRVVAEGSVDELKQRLPGDHVRLQFAAAEALDSAAAHLDGAVRVDQELALRMPGRGSLPELRHLLDTLDTAAVDVVSWSVHRPDLDDVFLALTGQPTEPDSAPTTSSAEVPR